MQTYSNMSSSTVPMVPLHTVGPYALYPLSVCNENEIATLFTKICARGNPILQGKPAKDLFDLGVAFYHKSVGNPASQVFLKGTEPVALFLAWDFAEGGIWKGTDGPPASLHCHAAIGAAAFASMPLSTLPGSSLFFAFTGVALPHPGELWTTMRVVALLAASDAGYRQICRYAVHPKTMQVVQAVPNKREFWRLTYNEIETADDAVREELCSIMPGYAECGMINLSWQVDQLSLEVGQHVLDDLRPVATRIGTSSDMTVDDMPLIIRARL